MSPEFILITGANGAGKTTLVESNRELLEKAGFRILIPDFILRYATSLTDSPAIIKEHIDAALSAKSHFLLETPFQFESLTETLANIRDNGYRMSMYQVFLKDEIQSAIRVKDRFQAGGMFISTEQVVSNFKANLDNVAKFYPYFDHSYFVDNSASKGMKLAAEFEKKKLIRFHASNNPYLKNLFTHSAINGKTAVEVLNIIKKHQDYPVQALAPKRPGHRLKF